MSPETANPKEKSADVDVGQTLKKCVVLGKIISSQNSERENVWHKKRWQKLMNSRKL